MVIDFQAHLFPEEYLSEMAHIQGNVLLEPPDSNSGMSYFYDRTLKCRINTATFRGRDPDRRIEHMDRLGIDVQILKDVSSLKIALARSKDWTSRRRKKI